MPRPRLGVAAVLGVVAALCCLQALAQQAPPAIDITELRPVVRKLGGATDGRRRKEAERLRKVVHSALVRLDTTAVHADAALHVTGEYFAVGATYHFRLRLLEGAKQRAQVQLKLARRDVTSVDAWQRELAPLFAGQGAGSAVPAGESLGSGTNGGSDSSGTEGSDELPAVTSAGSGSNTESPAGDVAELPPISSEGEGSATAQDDHEVLDTIARGITWHGHFQDYTAVGVRGAFAGDLVTFEDRLQLELDSNVEQVRIVGKPQLILDVPSEAITVRFREMYAERDFKRFEIAVGEQLVTWGVTDFWPVADIVNPRDLSQFRSWRPIDEKLPAPMLRTTTYLGPLTVHLLAVPILRRSRFELDRAQPFALPLPAPPGSTVEQSETPVKLASAGGGSRIDVALGAWKLSLYGLLGRDVIPAARIEVETTGATRIVVQNERLAMAAASVQGNVDALGMIVRAEAATYRRINDPCKSSALAACFYVRRTPTARANVSIERHVLPGLDAHLQLISEFTSGADTPKLPVEVQLLAPGLPEQYRWNRILTLRLQGDYRHGDFRPMAFAYWSLADEAYFGNLDLEYHVGDGFALALGGFYFGSYAKDPNKKQYTFVGSLESSSNVYLRATAWF
jgi:hypothetical protein